MGSMATREVPPSGLSALPHSASQIILAFQQLSPGRASASLGRGDVQWVWQGSSPVCRNAGECLCFLISMPSLTKVLLSSWWPVSGLFSAGGSSWNLTKAESYCWVQFHTQLVWLLGSQKQNKTNFIFREQHIWSKRKRKEFGLAVSLGNTWQYSHPSVSMGTGPRNPRHPTLLMWKSLL